MALELWKKNGGGILREDGGGVVVCESCPCEEEEPVVTGCCVDAIPRTLKVAVESWLFGNCSCAYGSEVTIVYNDATQRWEGTGVWGDGTCNGSPRNVTFYLQCGAGTPPTGGSSVSDWQLVRIFSDTCSGNTGMSPEGSSTCSPLDLTFTEIMDAACCNFVGPADARYRVTEP